MEQHDKRLIAVLKTAMECLCPAGLAMTLIEINLRVQSGEHLKKKLKY